MQDDPLTQALYVSYRRAGLEASYWAYYFLRELKKYGGLKVAKRMLAKASRVGDTKGFLALADAGRPDLSLEAVVLSPEFRDLFTPDEIAIASERLQRFPESSWRRRVNRETVYPDDVPGGREYREGAFKTVRVNSYERDPAARVACLAKHGPQCKVCALRFEDRYGEVGKDFIHVHHVKPLGMARQEYCLDPEKDLVPVCPNCHAMLHTSEPPLSVDELKELLRPR